jgi:hypothetical protein
LLKVALNTIAPTSITVQQTSWGSSLIRLELVGWAVLHDDEWKLMEEKNQLSCRWKLTPEHEISFMMNE